MMIFDHFNISAPKEVLAQEKDFFCQVFNMVVGDRPQFTRPGFWLYPKDSKQSVIHLTESVNHQRVTNTSYLDHIAFRMNDVKTLLQHLDNLSVEYHAQQLTDVKLAQVFFKSPAGIKIEVNFNY